MNGIGAKKNKPRSWADARAKVDEEGECRVCGSHSGLQAAHIIPRSLGGRQHRDSIVPLCERDHRSYDNFRLDILPYLTHDEQAEAVRVMGLERARRRLAPSAYVGAAA